MPLSLLWLPYPIEGGRAMLASGSWEPSPIRPTATPHPMVVRLSAIHRFTGLPLVMPRGKRRTAPRCSSRPVGREAPEERPSFALRRCPTFEAGRVDNVHVEWPAMRGPRFRC